MCHPLPKIERLTIGESIILGDDKTGRLRFIRVPSYRYLLSVENRIEVLPEEGYWEKVGKIFLTVESDR